MSGVEIVKKLERLWESQHDRFNLFYCCLVLVNIYVCLLYGNLCLCFSVLGIFEIFDGDILIFRYRFRCIWELRFWGSVENGDWCEGLRDCGLNN